MPQGTELKILSDSGASFKVGGYGVVFGDQDLTGDRFTADTDFWLDRITQTPMVMYQHGHDPVLKRTVVGRVITTKIDDIGLWVEAQITVAKKYADAIRQLIAKGVLGWSSSSVPQLVQRVKSAAAGVAEITSWPIIEFSLTPNPAEPRTIGVRELKALAVLDPLLDEVVAEVARVEAKATDGGKSMPDLPDSAFAFIEPGGVLDETKMTVPRVSRHFAHHAADGSLDTEMLQEAIAAAAASEHADDAYAHLRRHALKAGLPLSGIDDTHTAEWSQGTPPAVMAAGCKLIDLAENMATDHRAMQRLDLDTKGGVRLNATTRAELKEIGESILRMVEFADAIEAGDDGKRRVDFYRHKLALAALEVSA